jgi:hypothetical protein
MARRKKNTAGIDVGSGHAEATVPVHSGGDATRDVEWSPSELSSPWQSVWFRRVVTALLLLHLTAVVVAPLSVAPTSELFGSMWEVFQPYLEVAFMNHGYHFFAPEPGPSHLIRYEARRADGTTVTGEFPNKRQNWPRLLYHRHFMLTEFLNVMGSSDESEDVANRYARSYAHHIMSEYDADEVDLYLRRHLIPLQERVKEGARLDDASLYEELSLGTFKRNEL